MATVGYKIVSHKDAQDTEDEVHALLKEGWQLHGDLKVANDNYSQAMIQTESYGVDVIDYSLAIQIEDLDGVKYALEKIAEAVDDVGTNLAHVATAIGTSGQESE
jgi:hypothetical protein